MVTMLLLVGVIVIIQTILTYQESKPFLRRMVEIKHNGEGFFAKIKALPMLKPAIIDGGIAVIGGWMGFSGSLTGATAVLLGGLVGSLLMKWHRHVTVKKWEKELALAAQE